MSFWVNFQNGDIGLRISADEFCDQLFPICEVDGDLVRVGDHMVIGDDDAFRRIQHETGAKRLRLAGILATAAPRRRGRPF